LNLETAIFNWSEAPSDHYAALLGKLLKRERDAIHTESRLAQAHWHAIFAQLDPLASSGTNVTVDEIRLAISAALEAAVLIGPAPKPVVVQCERAVSYDKAVGYFVRELSIPRIDMEGHFDAWSDPENTRSLNACQRLLGRFQTGPRPTWGIPFPSGDPRPLDGLCAGDCHQRLALFPEIDLSEKVIMTYALPVNTRQTIPTIADAFGWSDTPPCWRSFFLPAPSGEFVGYTAPMISTVSGLPEIVHEPVHLTHLLHPLQKRS